MPVLFFFTGGHADYHRPGDTADKIDATGMARVASVGARVIERLAAESRPAYAQVTRPARRQGAGAAGGALLGVVAGPRPGTDGLTLSSVMPGTAAERAGLREGDVIVRFAGTTVDGLEGLRALIRDRRARRDRLGPRICERAKPRQRPLPLGPAPTRPVEEPRMVDDVKGAPTLTEMMRRRAALSPDQQYFRLYDETVTYGRLWEQSGRYAAGLSRAGVNAGDKVCLDLSDVRRVLLHFLRRAAHRRRPRAALPDARRGHDGRDLP